MHILEAQSINADKYNDTILRRGADKCFIRFVEEVGELAKALRNGDMVNIDEESADCLAWLFTVASINGVNMEAAYTAKYGSRNCFRCKQERCVCPEVNIKPLNAP